MTTPITAPKTRRRNLLVFYTSLTDEQFEQVSTVAIDMVGAYVDGSFTDLEDLDDTDEELIHALSLHHDPDRWVDRNDSTHPAIITAWEMSRRVLRGVLDTAPTSTYIRDSDDNAVPVHEGARA